MTATDQRPVVASQVEPRIVERRRTVLESRRRRRRRRWSAVAAVVVLAAAAAGALSSPLTDVDVVTVHGAAAVELEELQERSGISTGDQLVTVDLADARSRLRDMPMVAAVTVRRQWPDTVRITVVEEEPLLRVRAGERELVVSRTGRVLPAGVARGEELPVLQVPATPLDVGDRLPDPMRDVLVVYLRMPGSLAEALGPASLDDGALTFTLHDDATVRFGPVEDVPAKLVAVQAFLDQVALQCLDVLDVRQPDLPTASRVEGCAVPPPTDVAGAGSSADGDQRTADDGDTPQ